MSKNLLIKNLFKNVFSSLNPPNINQFNHPEQSEGWECMYTDLTIKVFRKRRERNDGSQYFEYQCIGSYKDISVDDFIQAQVFLNFF